MKKNQVLIYGAVLVGVAILFMSMKKKPVKRKYTINVPEPEKLTANQYAQQSGATLMDTLLKGSLFNRIKGFPDSI
jgi:hypothetical protein